MSALAGATRDIDGGPELEAWTTTAHAEVLEGVVVSECPELVVENSERLTSRVWGELRMGWAVGRRMFNAPTRRPAVIISSPAYITALVLSWWARLKRVPYVLELRDIYPEVYSAAGVLAPGSPVFTALAWASRRMYAGASLIIAATRGLGRELAGQSSKTPVQVVYNGFPAALLATSSPKRARFTVCVHGVLGFLQDTGTLVGVAKALAPHDIDFLVIGYGRKARDLQTSAPPNLTFMGRRSFDRTIELVSSCHVGLSLRSDDEISRASFPVKVWEYLGLGIPSVVTPHSEAGLFLEQHECGYQLMSGDVEGVAELILGLRDDPDRLDRLGANCRRIAPEYTREVMGARAAALIRQALTHEAKAER